MIAVCVRLMSSAGIANPCTVLLPQWSTRRGRDNLLNRASPALAEDVLSVFQAQNDLAKWSNEKIFKMIKPGRGELCLT